MRKQNQSKVCVYLNGGLGNQLFGWAAGFGLSNKLGVPLILNISLLQERRIFLSSNILKSCEIESSASRYYQYKSPYLRKAWRHFNFESDFFERSFDYDERFGNLNKPINLHGYFQSYIYFENVKDLIFDQIKEKTELSCEYHVFKKQYGSSQYVAIHVRRGDYLNNIEYHGVIEKPYYEKAIKKLPIELQQLQKIIFTDDIKAATLIFPNDIIISSAEVSSSFETMLLMSEGAALIGANSSFSLWSGFLLNAKNGSCFFPKKWFADPLIETKTLMPPQ